MPTPKIDSIIQKFVVELREAIREEGLNAFSAALGGGPETPKRKGDGPVRISVGVPRKKRAKGAKRTPEELASLTASVLSAIKKTPGQRAEQLAQTLGISTKDLALPIDKLKGEKAIKTKGQRRGTTYTAR